MNISLPAELEAFIAERIASGHYCSPDDVIGEALRLLRADEEEQQIRLAALRADISEGIASLERGKGIPREEAFARLRARRVHRST